jgi:pyridoxal 5'-phosphate synthase pdxT subunit
MAKPRVGILALQGDFEAHGTALARAGAEPVEVRTADELNCVDGLVIPGGESTTMLKLLNYMELLEPVRTFGETKPIFGTCAGAILLAEQVTNPEQASLNLMNIGVQRNGYGRQLDSRIVQIGSSDQQRLPGEIEAVFIRAPIIRWVGEQAKVLAEYNGDPVLVEQGRHLVATFHPELTLDPRVHELFIAKIRDSAPTA